MKRFWRGAAVGVTLAFGGSVLVFGSASGAGVVPSAPSSLAATQQYHSALSGTSTYFVMTDRYANGDTSNDQGSPDTNVGGTGYAPSDPGYFHGGDFKGLTGDCTGPTGLMRLKNLGFNSIWVTPPFGQNTVQGGSAAYHGYWIDKFDQIDSHLGTLADFKAFTDCAKQIGIKVILDVVVNHTGDVITYGQGNDFSYAAYKDSTGKTFDPGKYTTGLSFPSMNLSGFPKSPVVAPSMANVKSPAWANDVLNYHNRGDINFSTCTDYTCTTMGDFAGLDDLFTEKYPVMKGLADAYGYWVKNFPIAGFRIDTEPYTDANFFKRWLPLVQADAKAGGNPNFTVFGEDYNTDFYDTSSQVRLRNMPSVLDFPWQAAAAGYASGQHSAGPLGMLYGQDDLYTTAHSNAGNLETFLGNHDMGRIGCQLVQDGLSGTSLLKRDQLAHGMLMLLRGNPSVYYGDEVGMTGGGIPGQGCGDKGARQDMFPTSVSGWKTEQRIGGQPIGNGSSFDATATNPIASELTALGKLRAANPALTKGAQITRVASGAILAVSRIDPTTHVEYVAAFNNGNSAIKTAIATSTSPGATWIQIARNDRAVRATDKAVSSKAGKVSVTVPPTGWVVLKATKKLPGGKPVLGSLAIVADDLTGAWQVSQGVKSKGPVTVTFLTRVVGAKAWSVAGVDDNPSYSVYLEPSNFSKGARVAVQALVRSADGKVSASKIIIKVLRK